MLLGSISGEVILFSTARHTPSDVWIPMAVEPNWENRPRPQRIYELHLQVQVKYNTEEDYWSSEVTQHVTLTFIASMAYSTWNNLPSGENVFTPLRDRCE